MRFGARSAVGRDWLTYRSAALAMIAAGAIARIVALATSWSRPLDADAREYLLLAERYSFADPFSASYREPLWRALVKVTTGPFGYSPESLRVFTTLVSIATLPVAWLVFRRIAARWGLHQRVSLIALAVFALSLQLIREAPRGLREDLCLLLALVVASPLLTADRRRGAAVRVAVVIALLAGIRWELAALLVVIVTLFALARRVSLLAPAAAILCFVAVSAPWLLANRARTGDLTYHSKVHSTFYWKQEQPPDVLRRYATPPGADPKIRLSWSEYYLDYLGPAESARRVVLGYPRLLAKLAASQAVPRSAAVRALGENQDGAAWLVILVALAVAGIVAAAFAVTRLARRAHAGPVCLSALVMLLVSIAPYAVIAGYVEVRVLIFTVPLLALLAACAIDACLPQRIRVPAAVPAASHA
jgi:hypothetical protein